jgi:hypothetical protein
MHSLGWWVHDKRPLEAELAEFAWQCLESAPTSEMSEAHAFDEVAAALARIAPDRGFKLLATLLQQPYEKQSWYPLGEFGSHDFWHVLRTADRTRALRTILTAVVEGPSGSATGFWGISAVIDQVNDADMLLAFALENVPQALAVATNITTAKPGFWPLALKIVEKYPDPQEIQSALCGGIHRDGSLMQCRDEVQHILEDPQTPARVRPWLTSLEEALRLTAERHHDAEVDREINGWNRPREEGPSPEQLWAVRTLDRLGWEDKLLTILSRDELTTLRASLQL